MIKFNDTDRDAINTAFEYLKSDKGETIDPNTGVINNVAHAETYKNVPRQPSGPGSFK